MKQQSSYSPKDSDSIGLSLSETSYDANKAAVARAAKFKQLSAEERINQSRRSAMLAMRAAVDQKGLDVRGLDISANSDIADFFVIISGTSERHVKGIADKIKQALAQAGEEVLAVNGYEQGEWIVLDYGDLIVHIFHEPLRQYYGLDELWNSRAQNLKPDPELAKHIEQLRTGISW